MIKYFFIFRTVRNVVYGHCPTLLLIRNQDKDLLDILSKATISFASKAEGGQRDQEGG